jgi:tRNA pseudouridine55 synthase
VEAVLTGFRGATEQIPPMFSALKQHGRRLYTLARRGVEVERQPRQVRIDRLALLGSTATTLSLEVECSSGTYVRVLAHDIGARLGCGAHLRALVRTAIGPFHLAQAMPLTAFRDDVRRGDWRRRTIALSAVVPAFPALVLTASAAQGLAHGVAPTFGGVAGRVGSFTPSATVMLLGPDGTLRAVGSALSDATALQDMPLNAPLVTLRRVLN